MTAPVLVTGGAGYIGSHTVLALRDAGRPAVVLDDLSAGRRGLVPAGVPLEVGDVRDAAFVADVLKRHGCGSIVHFAAKIAVEESVREPELYRSVNVGGTRSVVEAALACNVSRIVFSSTASVYGEGQGRPCREDDPLAPANPYGETKRDCEALIAEAGRRRGLSYIIFRYFNVAGADPMGRSGQCGPETTHLIRAACEVALGKREALLIFGTDYPTPDGTGVRDYIHVSDVASAHLMAIDHLERGGASDILNIGYGRGFSVRDVVGVFGKVLGRPLSAREAPPRPGDTASVIADAKRIAERLGWRPERQDLEGIVRSALAWESGPKP